MFCWPDKKQCYATVLLLRNFAFIEFPKKSTDEGCALWAKLGDNFALGLNILPWTSQKAKFELPCIFWQQGIKLELQITKLHLIYQH